MIAVCRTRFRTALFGVVVLLAAGACEPAPPEAPGAAAPADALPAAAEVLVDELATLCKEGGGIPHTDEAVRRVELNGDGRDEFVLFAGWIQCENAYSIYGDRQKSVVVYAADRTGATAEAFSDWVFDVKIEEAGNTATLWLTAMAEQCGRPQAADFASESFCERAIEWNAGTGRFDYAPVSTVRMIE